MSTVIPYVPIVGLYIEEEWPYVDKEGEEDNGQKNTVPAIIGENVIVPISNERKFLQWKLIAEDTDSVIYLNKGENVILRCELEACKKDEAYIEYIKIICDEEKDYLIVESLTDYILLSHIIDKGKTYSISITEKDLIAIKGCVEAKRVKNENKESREMTIQFFTGEKKAEIQWICEMGTCTKIVAEEYILMGKKGDKYWKAVSYFKEEAVGEIYDVIEEIDDDCGWGEEVW